MKNLMIPTPPESPDLTQRAATRPQLELGDLLVLYLEMLGVEYVFGIPGGAIEPLYNALARSARRGGPRPVVARHETGAAFMADGYHKTTGRLGVVCATTGPGATNLITGVASAHANNIPLLVITAQTALPTFGKGAFQESSSSATDTVAMFEHCTRYNTLVSHVEQFERKLITAIMRAFQSPQGPVHLSIPLDILRCAIDVKGPSVNICELLAQGPVFDESATAQLADRLIASDKPVFLIGEGAEPGIDAILKTATALKATIVSTPQAKGLVSAYHPLYRGVFGFAGHSSAEQALLDPEVDLVVAIGSGLGEWATNGWDSNLLNTRKLVHVDSIEENMTRSPMAQLHVRGDARAVFERILQEMETKAGITSSGAELLSLRLHVSMDEEDRFYDDSEPMKPQRLMGLLTELFPPNTRYLADTGNSFAWAIHYLHPGQAYTPRLSRIRGSLFRSSVEFGSMGWAIGASVGTALGSSTSPVVCITGDGSLLMSGQEISTAVQEQLSAIFVVLNDSAYGMVKHGQRLAGAESVANELPYVDFAAYARALGAEGHVIHSAVDLLALDIDEICSRRGPTVLDVRVDPEQVPPIRSRMKVLGASAA